MESFLKMYFPSNQKLKIEKLKGDGGHRTYFRILNGNMSFILMDSGAQDASLKKFIFWQNEFRKHDLPVPKIFKSDLEQGLLLLEDLGDVSLEKIFRKKKNYKQFYLESLKNLILAQESIKLGKKHLLKFDFSFLKEEVSVAEERFKLFLKKQDLSLPDSSLFQTEMGKICEELHSLPFAFCHRDYHSRNLMIKNGKPYIIDFQDAGYGPYCYDVTSLVFDSYVTLSQKEKEKLMSFYFQNLPDFLKEEIQLEEVLIYHSKLLFLQRGFKACGCFVGFDNTDNKKTHLPFIKPTLKILEMESENLEFENSSSFFKSLNERISL